MCQTHLYVQARIQVYYVRLELVFPYLFLMRITSSSDKRFSFRQPPML